jgi:predicted transcriptional regulator
LSSQVTNCYRAILAQVNHLDSIYQGEIKEFFRLFKMWEKMAMHTHLKRLIKLGLVEKAEDCYYAK